MHSFRNNRNYLPILLDWLTCINWYILIMWQPAWVSTLCTYIDKLLLNSLFLGEGGVNAMHAYILDYMPLLPLCTVYTTMQKGGGGAKHAWDITNSTTIHRCIIIPVLLFYFQCQILRSAICMLGKHSWRSLCFLTRIYSYCYHRNNMDFMRHLKSCFREMMY